MSVALELKQEANRLGITYDGAIEPKTEKEIAMKRVLICYARKVMGLKIYQIEEHLDTTKKEIYGALG